MEPLAKKRRLAPKVAEKLPQEQYDQVRSPPSWLESAHWLTLLSDFPTSEVWTAGQPTASRSSAWPLATHRTRLSRGFRTPCGWQITRYASTNSEATIQGRFCSHFEMGSGRSWRWAGRRGCPRCASRQLQLSRWGLADSQFFEPKC